MSNPTPPPILLVSTTSTTTATLVSSAQSQAPSATPAFHNFLNPKFYTFVSSKTLSLSLLDDFMNNAIRLVPRAGDKAATLADEDLVPSALVKFKPIETDSIVFTALCNELLEISEMLTSGPAVAPV